MKTLLIPKQVITANPNDDILTNTAVEIFDDTISDLIDLSNFDKKNYEGEILEFPNLTLIPGFIQTHVHLCQTLFRGLADDLELLDWLSKKIFPFENAHSPESLRASAKLGIAELQKGGTTTIVDMGTLRHEQVIFEELNHSGMRAFAGKCLIDQNSLFPEFSESTSEGLKSVNELANEFHDSGDGRLKYAFSPRFVLSCTEALLKESFEMSKDHTGSIYHTHSSENKDEIKAVWDLHRMGNIEYFSSIGVLGESTLLAHCIHVDEYEQAILSDTGTRVMHCPSTNLKLGSGIANIPKYLNIGINVSLGADGPPCNNNLSIFNEMKLAAMIQKPFRGATSMNARDVFRMATINGAEAVGLADETGSIEINKKADLVLLDLNGVGHPLTDENLYSTIVYACDVNSVKEVMINGQWIVKEKNLLNYDESEIVAEGKTELNKLLNRIN